MLIGFWVHSVQEQPLLFYLVVDLLPVTAWMRPEWSGQRFSSRGDERLCRRRAARCLWRVGACRNSGIAHPLPRRNRSKVAWRESGPGEELPARSAQSLSAATLLLGPYFSPFLRLRSEKGGDDEAVVRAKFLINHG